MRTLLGHFFKLSSAQPDHDFSKITASEAYSNGLMGYASTQAARGDAHAAHRLGQIYLRSDDFHAADFWLQRASRLGLSDALRSRAELHLVFSSRSVEPNFLSNTTPSLALALSLVEAAIDRGVDQTLTLKARILHAMADPQTLHTNEAFLTCCLRAALSEKSDWSRLIMMIGAMSGQEICLRGKDRTSSLMGWLYEGGLAPLSCTYGAKLIMGKFLEGNYVELLHFSASQDNSEGLYLYGKYQIIVEKQYENGETMVRKAIRLGNVEAIAFLADYKASMADVASQLEADLLYKEASDKGHLGARSIMAIRGLQDQTWGLTKDRCLAILKECFLNNVPSAVMFSKRHGLFLSA